MGLGGCSLYYVSKRVFDVLLALMLLPFVFVLCTPLAAIFTLSTGEHPIFRQWRTGLQGNRFRIWKLRTMREARGADGELLSDAERLTRLGTLFRKLSIDEMPQLINILKGEMSFVGPRPQVDDFLRAMTEEEKRRHDVLPGITGWAQINGRNAMSWSDRFELDLWYVDNASFRIDLKIIWMTPRAILSGRDTQHATHVTMPTLFEERYGLKD